MTNWADRCVHGRAPKSDFFRSTRLIAAGCADTAPTFLRALALAGSVVVISGCAGEAHTHSAATAPAAPPTASTVSAIPSVPTTPTAPAPAPSSSKTSTALPSAPATSRCHTNELGVRYRSQQGAAGSTIYFFSLDNRSARACSVFGYVGVAAFNSQGASEPLVLQRDSSKPSRTELLRPGASSFFQLQAGNPTNQSAAASCARATTLHVTPPDERAYMAIEAHDFTSCGNHTVATGAVHGQ